MLIFSSTKAVVKIIASVVFAGLVFGIALIDVAKAVEIEPSRVQIWAMRVEVWSPGIPVMAWAFEHSTHEGCESARPKAIELFHMRHAPFCLPQMVPLEKFKEILQDERQIRESREERGT